MGTSNLLNFSYSCGYVAVYFLVVLTFIPLLNNGIEHLTGLLGHLDILFCQVPAQISRLFFY